MGSLEVQKVVFGTPLAEQVNNLYTNAFPREDKFAFDAVCRFTENSEVAEFAAYLDEGRFCGFTFTLAGDNYVYVLYMATDVSIRSKGYGTRILSRLKETYPQAQFVLDIELPNEHALNAEQRYRRRDFYERNGFWCTGDVFGVDDSLYLIMTTGDTWDEADFMEKARQTYGFLCNYYFGDIHHCDDEVRKPAGRDVTIVE